MSTILLSTAYLPPVEYFALISKAGETLIEREENYIKQTYRNRCYILSSHGRQLLSVPVFLGSIHKTPLKEIRIDYSKRWQQVHLGALTSSYNASPYFQFYFDNIEKIISKNARFLIDLNTELTESVLSMLNIDSKLKYTDHFEPPGFEDNDYRYKISPKKPVEFRLMEYPQVFNNSKSLIPQLSILDLIFNMGPEAIKYL